MLAALVLGLATAAIGGLPADDLDPQLAEAALGGNATRSVWPLPEDCRRSAEPADTTDRTALPGMPGAVVLADYDIVRGRLVDRALPAGEAAARRRRACDRRLWAAVSAVYPTAARDRIGRLVLFDARQSPDDDVGHTLAYIVASDDRSGWTLAVAPPAVQDDDELADTLVHELAHLLTLGPDQVDAADGGPCPTLRTTEGCALPGSVLAGYLATWDPTALALWRRAAGEGGVVDAEAAADLFAGHPDDFVTEYAATSPEEDLAETLAAWCRGKPLPGKALQDKARYLSGRRELRDLPTRCAALRAPVSP